MLARIGRAVTEDAMNDNLRTFSLLAAAALCAPCAAAEPLLRDRVGGTLSRHLETVRAAGWTGAAPLRTPPVPALRDAGPAKDAWTFQSLLDRIAAVGTPVPIALFDKIAAAAGLPPYRAGDAAPYGKLNKPAPGLQKVFIVRVRADKTMDILVQSNPHDTPTLSYVVDRNARFLSGTSALKGVIRPMNGAEAAKLPEEIAYWKAWQEGAAP